MHALEWIQKHGRYQRSVALKELRKLLHRQKGECTWCGGKITNGMIRWCSDECRTEGYLRGDANAIRRAAMRRDKGVCASCGNDTLAMQHRLISLPYSERLEQAKRLDIPLWRRPFEIDHIVPVVEGGGLCGLDGFRTLCTKCHKEESALLAGRRAQARRNAMRPMFSNPGN